MRVLVVGGAGSGKSAYAERLACSLSAARTYVATMESRSPEARSRIARHQRQRAGLGFQTLECPMSLAEALPEDVVHGVALLEDVGNLVANTLFLHDGSMQDPSKALELIKCEFASFCHGYDHVVVVGNQVGSSKTPSGNETLAWVRVVGALCCWLAAQFDVVVEVTTGIPLVVKGRLP